MTRRTKGLAFGGVLVLFRYNVTPHYPLLSSLYARETFKKLAADIELKLCLQYNVMISPSVKIRFSIIRGPRELLFVQLVVLLHRSKRRSNSF